MTSILFVIGRIYRNQFNCNCLRKRKFFQSFAVVAAYLKYNFEYLTEKMTLIGYVFSKLETANDVVS